MRTPRLYWWAAAFAVGIALSRMWDPWSTAPALWLSMLALVALAGLRPRSRGGPERWLVVMALCALSGAGRAACERAGRPDRAGVGVDDRGVDAVVGIVAGPVEDAPGRRRFVLDAGERIWVTARAPAPALLPGDRVVVRGRLRRPRGYRNPGALDRRELVAARGAALELTAAGPDVEVVERGAAASVWRWPTAVQRRAAARLVARGGDRTGVAVARAMVLGDRGGLEPELAQRFRDAGVAHVLAVSGLHLAVVAALVFGIVRRLWAVFPGLVARAPPRAVAALAAAPGALAFAVVTGARISTLRALLVVAIVLAGYALDRRARVVDALGAAALALLLARPSSLWEPSFQLSFAAALTLAFALGRTAHQPRRSALGRAWAWAWGLFRASVWASAATAPFTALAFGTVATGGPVANLVVVPAAELVVVPLGLLGTVLSALHAPLGGWLLDVAIAVAGWIDAAAGAVAARAPVLAVPPPNGWELAGAVVIWAAALGRARGLLRRSRALALVGAGAAVIAASAYATIAIAPAARSSLTVTFLDVGQGDAAVLELPGGEVWLVDSGGLPFVFGSRTLAADEVARRAALPGEHAVARFLAQKRIRRIDVAVLSHPHPDHYAGLSAVARAVPIGALWVAREAADEPDRRGDSGYRALVASLRARGTRIVHPVLGAPVTRGGARMTALAPRYLGVEAAADPVMGANDNSLVLAVEFAGRRLLFAGDLEQEGEELLVAAARHEPAGIAVDVVKVPHHGSRTSSTAPFVAATRPGVAVISCGVANRFGFPADEVVERWRAVGARVLRTDLAGAVTVTISPSGRIAVGCFDPEGQPECVR